MAIASLFAFVAVATTCGCARKSAPDAKSVGAPTNANATANAIESAEAPHGSRKNKDIDVPVFVDGKQLATLRYGELPASVPVRDKRYYALHDYLAALGVPTDRIRSVHLRGNSSRISSIDGSELATEKARFLFDFMGGTTGLAKTRFDTTGLKNTFRIDEIREVLVYVDKDVPSLNGRRSCYLDQNECSDKVPYAEEPVAKGTRVYLDGKLVGQVKRRRLGDDLVVGKDDTGLTKFALPKLLASFGIDVAKAKTVELIAGDDVIARAPRAGVTSNTFVLQPHAHGRVTLTVPASWQASDPKESKPEDRAAQVTAVLVYQATSPKARALTPITDVPPSDNTVPADDG